MVKNYPTIIHSQINRRINKLRVKRNKAKEGDDGVDVIIAIDNTGIKVTNRGQWIRDKWNVKKKGYLKIHLTVNIKEKVILSFEVTDERVHDSKVTCKLIDNIKSMGIKIRGAFVDGAYDTNANFMYLSSGQIQPMIRVRRNATVSERNCSRRNKAVILQTQKDWKREMSYGKRCLLKLPLLP